jgi:hypothetical protein
MQMLEAAQLLLTLLLLPACQLWVPAAGGQQQGLLLTAMPLLLR